MPSDPILQSAAELLVSIYDDIHFCPLEEEHDLLLSSGKETWDALFDACQSVFGMNVISAFRKACVYTANYCDFLYDHLDVLLQESHAGIIIDAADKQISAIEYLAAHAPTDSIEEEATLHDLAYHSRFCYNSLCKRYRAHIKSCKRKRT